MLCLSVDRERQQRRKAHSTFLKLQFAQALVRAKNKRASPKIRCFPGLSLKKGLLLSRQGMETCPDQKKGLTNQSQEPEVPNPTTSSSISNQERAALIEQAEASMPDTYPMLCYTPVILRVPLSQLKDLEPGWPHTISYGNHMNVIIPPDVLCPAHQVVSLTLPTPNLVVSVSKRHLQIAFEGQQDRAADDPTAVKMQVPGFIRPGGPWSQPSP